MHDVLLFCIIKLVIRYISVSSFRLISAVADNLFLW